MAASNKPTAVHFTAVFFGMMTLILAVTTYMGYKERSDAVSAAQTASDDKNKADSALSNALGDVEAIKTVMGYNFSDVGTGSPAPPNSLLGQLNSDLTKYGKDLQAPTVAATLAAMRSALDQTQTDLAQKEQALKDEESRMLALNSQSTELVKTATDSQDQSETTLQDFIKARNETLKQKDQEIDTLRNDINRERVDKEQIREQMTRLKKDLDDQIADLERVNQRMRDELDDIKRVSFEVPDAVIRNVDNTTRTVWLNIGEDDEIRPQVTFSVYDQNHQGVGRPIQDSFGAQDIKGSVEVVRVLGPHLCEARILTEQLDRPMAPGDVVYSPIWTAGLVEEFAFVGEIDFNKDKRSDRKQLHDLLNHANAGITLEVDDQGNRNPPDAKIDVNTKFLVIGYVPDPALFAAQDPELDRVQRMNSQKAELEKEAKRQGIRIVRLNDFLAYMGFKPQQRLFVPGTDAPYTLNSGKPATGVAETIGRTKDESSSGNTSELFRRNRATGELYDN